MTSVLSVAKKQEVNMDEKCSSIKGIYRDVLLRPDKTVIFDSGWQSNLIVDVFRVMLAEFMKNKQYVNRGITYLKVGKGYSVWDENGAPAPNEGMTGLIDPDPFVLSEAGLLIECLDENDVVTDSPTSRLQVTATLGTDQPPGVAPLSSYPLREFGLFGEYEDDTGAAQDYMIDCIRHPVIHKDASTTLIRVVRLYL